MVVCHAVTAGSQELLLGNDEDTAHVRRYPQSMLPVHHDVVGPCRRVLARWISHDEVTELSGSGIIAVDAVVGSHPQCAVGILIDFPHSVVRE